MFSCLGTAGNWFLLDVTFYANGLFSATILEVAGVGTSLSKVLEFNIILALIALPGYPQMVSCYKPCV